MGIGFDKNEFDKGFLKKKYRNIVILNAIIIGIAMIGAYMAMYMLSEQLMIKVIFTVQLFAGVSNTAIWIITVWMYGLGLDTKEYFNQGADKLNTALDEVDGFMEVLNSEDLNKFIDFVKNVDWSEAKDMYSTYTDDNTELEKEFNELENL